MGSSSKQTTGYRYFSNFLLFIGNPIEKLIGINFDKRGWQNPLVDENQNALEVGTLNLPNLYGENEGGVAGKIYARYGTNDQPVVPFYKAYMDAQNLPASAFPYQSYLAFTGLGAVPVGGWAGSIIGSMQGQYNSSFYLGNSGYMKEMLLWPKRTRIRNDGRRQWYEVREDGAIVCEIGSYNSISDKGKLSTGDILYIRNWDVAVSNGGNSSGSFSGTWGLPSALVFPPLGLTGDVGESGSLRVSLSFTATGYGIASVEFFYTRLKDKAPNLSLIKLFNIKETIIEDSTENITTTRKITADFFISQGFELSAATSANAENDATIVFDNFRIFDHRLRAFSAGEGIDINPIHKIREILTDDTAMNKPESDVNDINFMKAADRIFDEGLGISWSITEKSCLDAINELCGHIEAGVRVNRQTGLYEMVLFRDDWFSDDEIHTLAVNKIKSMSLDVSNADEAINQLNVSYYNRAAIKDSSFSVAENASIRNLNGRVNAEDADFPYFMNQRNAAVVAQWKLKQMSSPVWSGSFTTAAYEARKWNRYDLLKLAWPRKWQGTITVRIMKINLGVGTDVSIDFVEVVPYSSELSSNIVIDTPIDVTPLPPQACQYEPFELPYYLAVMALGQRQVDDELAYENNYGLAGVVAEKPQNNSLYAVMMTHDGTEGEEWLRAATIDYEATADLDQTISKTSTSFTVKNSSSIANVAAGTLIKCGSDWIGTPGEWMVFQGIDPYTGVVSVKRGALDSLPQAWGVGTKMYLCSNDVAYDQTEYVSGEEVLVAALTATPSGLQKQDGSIAIEMNARAFRPYPPANVKINGEYWPKIIDSELFITLAHRNRKQQTGGEIIGWYQSSVTLEEGVEYIVELYEIDQFDKKILFTSENIGDANNAAFDLSNIDNGTKAIEINIKSVRDSYACLHPFIHVVNLKSSYIDFKVDPDEKYGAPNDDGVNFSL